MIIGNATTRTKLLVRTIVFVTISINLLVARFVKVLLSI